MRAIVPDDLDEVRSVAAAIGDPQRLEPEAAGTEKEPISDWDKLSG
jgi:hypothetical protein